MPNNEQIKPAAFCPGCGHTIILRSLYRVLQNQELTGRAVIGLDIGCSLLAYDMLPINTFQTHHGRPVPTMVGFRRARKDTLAIVYAGDGGAYSIGLQSLLWAARRNEPILVIVVNNTVYGMTGGQTAPTSLRGQVTDTAPGGHDETPILGPELIRSLNERAYIARTAVNEPANLAIHIEKAIKNALAGNFSLVEILSYCPTNWRTKGGETDKHLNGLKSVFKTGEIL